VYAQAYDNPIPGFETKTVSNLRLFEALPETELDMAQFNEGNFAKVGLVCAHVSEHNVAGCC
jgi:glucan phosphorylase